MQHLRNKGQSLAIAAVATIGLFDATLLTIHHYTDNNLACTITHGCEQVLTSKYATIAHIPIALFGVLFYFTILVAALASLSSHLPKLFLRLATTTGFVATLGLVYLQAFVLKAWCQYCLISALSSTILFLLCLRIPQPNKEERKDG